ncbi:DUF4926 domain-containing protein [Cyanobacterium sp. DS4]|uniref:DUF4926 domain-containing protein n=1 Tax=Cyanobacterium sp. DS4 TaxID=2878255 RepID=UPI002E8100EF|nr:DUF4926 domain-containing protein [Cyanobacterium sp. Dongsha4]WVL01953.1 DUF4926 domain-containing protein [Cyanobacterium sp. Dongsha4]
MNKPELLDVIELLVDIPQYSLRKGEQGTIVEDYEYALNINHLIGEDKTYLFEKYLGYTQNNYDFLKQQIKKKVMKDFPNVDYLMNCNK